MNGWLYRFLNAQAKAWRYYDGNRPKQRQSIKDNLRSLREIISCREHGAHAKVSYTGEVSVMWQPMPVVHSPLSGGGSSSRGLCSWSGMGMAWQLTFIKLNIPVIDCTTADYVKLLAVTIKGPMAAVGEMQPDEHCGSLSYRPLAEVIEGYRKAGCTIFNAPAPQGWAFVETGQ